MQALDKTILEDFADAKLSVRMHMDAVNTRMVATIYNQIGEVVATERGVDKNAALAALHAAWSKPAAKPTSKKKASKKKSAPKTAPIEADAPDADGGDDDG